MRFCRADKFPKPRMSLKGNLIMVNRRSVLTSAAATAALASVPFAAQAQSRKDTLVVGMALEPAPGLDPTGGAAAAIGEIALYNIFETLTKINRTAPCRRCWPRAGKSRPTSRPTPSACARASSSTTVSRSMPTRSSSRSSAPPPKRASTRTSALSPRWSAWRSSTTTRS